jgi:hypothetical protein
VVCVCIHRAHSGRGHTLGHVDTFVRDGGVWWWDWMRARYWSWRVLGSCGVTRGCVFRACNG